MKRSVNRRWTCGWRCWSIITSAGAIRDLRISRSEGSVDAVHVSSASPHRKWKPCHPCAVSRILLGLGISCAQRPGQRTRADQSRPSAPRTVAMLAAQRQDGDGQPERHVLDGPVRLEQNTWSDLDRLARDGTTVRRGGELGAVGSGSTEIAWQWKGSAAQPRSRGQRSVRCECIEPDSRNSATAAAPFTLPLILGSGIDAPERWNVHQTASVCVRAPTRQSAGHGYHDADLGNATRANHLAVGKSTGPRPGLDAQALR